MRRPNPFGNGLIGGLGLPLRPGDVNAGPTTSHLQNAMKERLVSKLAAPGVAPAKAIKTAAPAERAPEKDAK